VHQGTEEKVVVLSRVSQRAREEEGDRVKRTNAKLGHDRDDLGEVLEEALFLLPRKIHVRLQGALDGHLRASPFVSANFGIGIVVVSVADGGGSDEVVVVVVVVVVGGGGGGGGVDLVTGRVDVRVAGFVRGVRGVRFGGGGGGGGVRGGVRGEGSGALVLCVRGGGGGERVIEHVDGEIGELTRAFRGDARLSRAHIRFEYVCGDSRPAGIGEPLACGGGGDGGALVRHVLEVLGGALPHRGGGGGEVRGSGVVGRLHCGVLGVLGVFFELHARRAKP
jgi:hypothetical protein